MCTTVILHAIYAIERNKNLMVFRFLRFSFLFTVCVVDTEVVNVLVETVHTTWAILGSHVLIHLDRVAGYIFATKVVGKSNSWILRSPRDRRQMINTENDVEGFYRKFQNNMIRSEVFS